VAEAEGLGDAGAAERRAVRQLERAKHAARDPAQQPRDEAVRDLGAFEAQRWLGGLLLAEHAQLAAGLCTCDPAMWWEDVKDCANGIAVEREQVHFGRAKFSLRAASLRWIRAASAADFVGSLR